MIKFSKKTISLIIRHLEENYNKKELLDELVQYSDFIEESHAYRICVNHSNNINIGDSFSLTKEGILFFLKGQIDRFQGEEAPIMLYSANIRGINLKKVILFLKERNLINDYLSSIHQEDEILALEINNLKLIYQGDLWDFLENPQFD